ncbi:MAG: Crp/Fnr family transcriptional regulator [Tannerella sp.]|jgi:CRP-like cAMP-binding protein|nr:Crp/Fnr family transcriptional regulator [Tannerella sp.]
MEVFKNFLMDNLKMPLEDLGIISDRISYRTVEKNEFIVSAGSISGCTYFVEKGVLRMYSISESGKEHIIQFAPELWLIADRRSTYLHEPSAFYIQAIEDSEVVFIQKGFIEDIIRMYPDTAEKITLLLQRHIMLMQHRVNMLLSATAEELYLDFLETYPHLLNRVPLYMIASFLGITPESLSRLRSELNR